ncbi:MAG: zf-TFIIB domain-containing protein [Acidimicrobiales bacterium]
MYCPKDRTTLQTTERGGVSVHWCPTCRGVWMDRAELDKVFGPGAGPARPPAVAAQGEYASVDLRSMTPAAPTGSAGLYDRYRNGNLRTQAHSTRERRLAEIFDF